MTQRKALWASTAARGGIATFVTTMQETSLWTEWNIRVVSTHTNGTPLTRVSVFSKALFIFVAQLLFRRPDIVHLHTASYGSFFRKGLLVWTASTFRLPVVLHMHGADFLIFFAEASRPVKSVIRVTLERADAVVALGEAWATQLRAVAPGANIVVVPNAVRPNFAVNQDVAGPIHVAFIGEIGYRKGTFSLLDAWASVVADADHQDVRLTIVGDGEVDRARIRCTELGLDDTVAVIGWIAHSDVQELLTQTHVLVLPSRDEGQPMAILEAMARGLCVIATNVGGIPELLEHGCGVLVQPDDVQGLAHEIRRVVDDDAARTLLGRNALRRICEHFDVDVVSRRFDALYRELISQRQTRKP